MADKNDWFFWVIVLAGGFLLGYLIEQHFHIIDTLFLGGGPAKVEEKQWPPIAVASEPTKTAKKFYPNPMYDPYVANEWDDLDDSWYYMY